MNPRIKNVSTLSDYKLHIEFTNGENGIYDCLPILDFGVFKELKDLSYFNQAQLLDGTVVWPHDQDICPDTLYLESIKCTVNGAPTEARVL
ncbi:MAG: DUF2442 domain-containing protein [Planctomycetota bacterium]